MASISNDPNGRRRILFSADDGPRKAIHLGKMSQRAAARILYRVEQLIEAKLTGHALDVDMAGWVGELHPKLAEKLARVGLIPKPQRPVAVKLGEFLGEYLATRSDIKPSTRRHLEQAREKLVGFFGADKTFAIITAGDADEFRLHLFQQLGDNTARRMCGRAKQFFRAALRKRLIAENPFGDMKGCGVQPNRARDYFVTRDDAQKVLDACPDAQWRLLFALSRYGGLRCPSEHLLLKWADVDWERGKIRVTSPKTEHHEGRGSRMIPIFPELRPFLEEVWEFAEPGTEYVITRYRDRNSNLRTQLERIIRRAGLEPWPKLFQNLRATRETELAESFPLHVTCAWLGNTQSVATRHYLQVTDDHFKEGASEPTEKVAQKAAQQMHADSRGKPSVVVQAQEKTPENRGIAALRENLRNAKAPRLGLEPRT